MNSGSSIKVLIFLGIIALAMFILGKFYSKFKVPRIGSLCLVNGGLKTGKSTVAFYIAYVNYRRAVRIWKIRIWFQKLLHRELDEEPLFYSNIPVNIPYVKLTDDLILMKKRFRRKSVVFIDEASLVADSMLYKDGKINERLMMFVKLFGHCTHGGSMVINTQAISDLHFAFKRCISQYYYIHHLEKHIPFLLVAKMREERYSDDDSVINTYNEDVEQSLKRVLLSKRTWKRFDAFAFSFLADDKPCESRVIDVKSKDLKAREIVSFRQFINEQFKRYQDGSNNSGRSESNSARDNKCDKVCNDKSQVLSNKVASGNCDDNAHKGGAK